MKFYRLTSWKVAVTLTLTVLPGCTLPSRNGNGLGGLSAVNPPVNSPAMTQQRIEADHPVPEQYAASREAYVPRTASAGSTQVRYGVSVSSDDGAVGGVSIDHQAPPSQRPPLAPRGARPYAPIEGEYVEPYGGQANHDSNEDWEDASTQTAKTAARVAYYPAKSPVTQTPGQWPAANQHAREDVLIRGQSPTFGGQLVQPLPQRTPGANYGYPDAVQPPPGGSQVYQAGTGVNQPYQQPQQQAGFPPQQVMAYQPPPPPIGGQPVQPVTLPFTPDSSLVTPDDLDQVQDIDIPLQETQTGRLMLGAGINSDAGLVGNLVIDEQNFDIFRPSLSWNDWVNGTAFRGAGQRFRMELMPGTEVQRYSFNFQDPYIFDLPISFGFSAFYFQRNYTDWNEQRTGVGINGGYLFPERPDLSLTVGLRAESVEISNPAVPTPPQLAEVVGNNDLYTARVALAHDTRDSSFLPTEGHLISLAYEQGFGTFSFPRFEGDARQYFVMRQRPDGSGRHILGASAKIGVAGSDTPIFEHFFAGGFSTIRGFAFRGASPQQNGVIVGGEFELLTSLEYRFPLTASDALYGSFFVDAGTVEPNANIYASDFRVTPGFELRISVPAMGPIPIAVGIGVPIAHAPGDDIQNFHFFVGVTR